jgi:putative flippase GtrA
MILVTNKKERTRFLRFAVVGSMGAVIDFGTFNLLTLTTPIHPVLASVISFIVAVCNSFLWNRFWTYPDSRSKSVPRQIAEFFFINIIGLAIRTPLFAWMEKVFVELFSDFSLPDLLTPTFLGHNFALAIAVIVVMFWNFFANRYWTYNDVSS